MHYSCVPLTEAEFKKILPMNKAKWKCLSCKKPKPISSPASLSTPTSTISLDIEALKAHIDAQFLNMRREIQLDLNSMESRIETQLSAFTQSLTNLETRIDTLEADTAKKITKLEADTIDEINKLSQENSALRSEISLLKVKWEDIEQRARMCNLEIQNVPEKRGENLHNILDALGKVINIKLSPDCIKDVHRVAHNTSTDKPKNIIVQLSSRRLRDDIIAAVRVRRGLTYDQISSGGNAAIDSARRIFVNEHLTLKNKILYARTRDAASNGKYKYVWVKNACIFVRKDVDTKVITVRKESDLHRII